MIVSPLIRPNHTSHTFNKAGIAPRDVPLSVISHDHRNKKQAVTMVFDVDEDDVFVAAPRETTNSSSAIVSIQEEQDSDFCSSVPESESFLSEDDEDGDDDDKDDSGDNGSTVDNTDSNSSPMTEMQKYAAMENKLVNRWRRIVIVSILLTGAIVGGITYLTLNNEQSNDSSAAVRCYHSFTVLQHYSVLRRNIY